MIDEDGHMMMEGRIGLTSIIFQEKDSFDIGNVQ